MNISKVKELEAELAHVHHEYTMLEQLFAKYIDNVTECEGCDFTSGFSDDETQTLYRLSSYRNDDGTWRKNGDQ